MPALVSQAFTAILIYTMISSVLLFMVLPFGVKPPEAPKEGHAHGAPEVPHLGRKILITSLISIPLTWLVMHLIASGAIPLRNMVS